MLSGDFFVHRSTNICMHNRVLITNRTQMYTTRSSVSRLLFLYLFYLSNVTRPTFRYADTTRRKVRCLTMASTDITHARADPLALGSKQDYSRRIHLITAYRLDWVIPIAVVTYSRAAFRMKLTYCDYCT